MNSSPTPRVLCFVPYGSWHVHNQLDCIIGTTLRVRGAEVALLTCDGLFQDDCYVLAHSKNPKEDCATCSARGQQFFGMFPLPVEQIRTYADSNDADRIDAWLSESNIPELSQAIYEGLPIGEWVRASVRSYHVVNPRSLALPQVQALFRKYIKYAWVTYNAAKRFFDAFKPTHVFMFGGYGFLHAPVHHLALSRGCRVVTHERGHLPSRFMIAVDDLVDSMEALATSLDAWENVPLNEEEFTQIRSIFLDWETGKNRSMGRFFQSGTEDASVRAQLGIPSDAPLLAAFTSGEHELPTEALRVEGGRQLELIGHLIETFRNRKEYLIIRHHPNLGAGIRTKLDYNYLTRAYKQLENLPPNVRVIMPNERLTSYSILWNASATIPFMSTLAIESIARGLPTATMPLSSFQRVATHVIDDFSFEGISKLVGTLFNYADESFGCDDIRKAYTFARAHHMRFSTLFRSFGIRNSHEPDIRITKIEDLAPGNDATLDRICDFVLKGTSLYDLPTQSDLSRDRSIEKKLLSTELTQIRERRRTVKAEQERYHLQIPLTAVITVQDDAIPGDPLHITGILRQRNAPIEHSTVTRSEKTLEEIIQRLKSSSAEFALVTNCRFSYDESFLINGTSSLIAAPEKGVLLNGAWLQEGDQILYYLFTEHNSLETYADFEKYAPRDPKPDDMLGFALFRRNLLLELLGNIQSGKGDSYVKDLFAFLKNSASLGHPVPTLRYRQKT